MNYYAMVGRDITPANVHYTNQLVRFQLQIDALKKKAKKDDKEPTKCTPTMPVRKFVKHFEEDLNEIYSPGNIPVPYGYVIRSAANVGVIGDLQDGECFSVDYVSIQDELMHRHLHTNPMWADDNAHVFGLIDKATAGVPKLNASIANQRRARDGRGAWLSIKRQHCGDASYENLVEESKKTIDNSTYTGTSPHHTLEMYTNKRRSAWNDWIDASQNITTQVPLESELVASYLKGIKCTNPGVCAAVALIKNDKGVDGMANNFETAAAYLIKECPVAEKLRNKSNINATVSATDGEDYSFEEQATTSNGVTLKSPIGKTGVYLGWISDPRVFRNLTPEQKAEREAFAKTEAGRTLSLKEYEERKRKRSSRGGGKIKKLKSTIATLQGDIEELNKRHEQVQIASLLSGGAPAAVASVPGLPPPPPPVSVAPGNQAMARAAAIQSILRRSNSSVPSGAKQE